MLVYIGCWGRISNGKNWMSTMEPNISEGATFRLNQYMSMKGFEEVPKLLNYTNREDV